MYTVHPPGIVCSLTEQHPNAPPDSSHPTRPWPGGTSATGGDPDTVAEGEAAAGSGWAAPIRGHVEAGGAHEARQVGGE